MKPETIGYRVLDFIRPVCDTSGGGQRGLISMHEVSPNGQSLKHSEGVTEMLIPSVVVVLCHLALATPLVCALMLRLSEGYWSCYCSSISCAKLPIN